MYTLENSPVVLVDIVHDENFTRLIDAELEPFFYEKVLQNLRPEDKICLEGFNLPQGLMPTDRRYEETIIKCWPTHATTHRPVLYGADPRQCANFERRAQLDADQAEVERILCECIRLTQVPTSIDEAFEWVRAGRCEIQFTRPFTRAEIKMADQAYRRERVWVKNYHDLAVGLTRRGGRVHIVAGLAHIIHLHMCYGWPLMWLSKHLASTTPEDVYHAGMDFTHFVDKIRRLRV